MTELGILPDIRRLMASWTGVPAFVRNERLDVVASNPLAAALSESFAPGVNLARFAFLDPSPRSSADDWSEMAAQVVAVLRASANEHRGDADLRRLVGELASKDSGFADTWALDHRDRRRAPRSRSSTTPAVGYASGTSSSRSPGTDRWCSWCGTRLTSRRGRR